MPCLHKVMHIFEDMSCAVTISRVHTKKNNLMIAFAALWKDVEYSSHRGHPHTAGHPLPHQPSCGLPPAADTNPRILIRRRKTQCNRFFSFLTSKYIASIIPLYTVTSPLYRNWAQCSISPHAPLYEELKHALLHYPENKSILHSNDKRQDFLPLIFPR